MSVFLAVAKSPYFALLLRIFLSLTFIISSVSKLPHHTEFEAVVKDYDLLPDALASVYAGILPWAEMLVGVYLLFGILFRPALVALILLAISFTVANISSLVGDDPYCGNCFGDLWTLETWQAFVLDVAVLLAASHLLFRRTGDRFLTLDSFLKDS